MSSMKSILIITLILFTVIVSQGQETSTKCTKLQLVASGPMTRENLPFEVTVKKADGGEIEGASVIWTTSLGRIVKGDGTPHVVVEPKLPEDEISSEFEVTAKVSNLAAACNTFLKATYSVYVIADPDFWGKPSPMELRWQLDNLYIQLDNSPLFEAVLVIHFAENATRAYRIARLKSIYSSIKFRHYDPTRLSIYVAQDYPNEQTMVLFTKHINKLAPTLINLSEVIKAEDIPSKVATLFPRKKLSAK